MRVKFRCDPSLVDILPRPEPARAALPDWLRKMPATAFSDLHGAAVRTFKQCPPFVDAMSHGFVLRLPCDVHVADGRLSWDWDCPALTMDSHPRSPLAFHVAEQAAQSPLFAADQAFLKFNSFWSIELEPGYSLFATHPVNRADLPFRTLTGLVECDRYSDIGVLFPAMWTDPSFAGVLARGTPVVQAFPVARAQLELDCAAFDEAAQARYRALSRDILAKPGVYRREFRDGPGSGDERAL